MTDLQKLARETRHKLCLRIGLTLNTIALAAIEAEILSALERVREESVQDYDERICNHIIAMIERLSARERKIRKEGVRVDR